MPPSRPRPTYARLDSRYLWQSHWYNVRQDRLRAPDGQELTYTVIEKPQAVWIVPLTARGELVLIDQYRYPVGQWCLEVPAGNIERGHSAQQMAERELREEIGGRAARWVRVGDFFTMNGIGDERAQVFAALGVELGTPHREPTEHIMLRVVPLEEGLRMARAGAIQDGPSALAILLAEPVLREYVAELGR